MIHQKHREKPRANPHEKPKDAPSNATLERVRRELMKPRVAKSARITKRNLVTTRLSRQSGSEYARRRVDKDT
jgi:hypothetical protein